MCPIEPEYSEWSDGTTATTASRVPGVPYFIGNAASQITFNFSEMGNDSVVEYAIYVADNGTPTNYLAADGTISSATAVWQTKLLWGSISTTAVGLTSTHEYTFKVKSRNQAGAESAFSSYSYSMLSYIELSLGALSDEVTVTIENGNTRVSNLSASTTYNMIGVSFTLINKTSTASSVTVEYSKDSGLNWLTPTTASALTNLTTSPTGVSHTVVWVTCTDLGNSYSGSPLFRITPYDAATIATGYADTASTLTMTVNNLPVSVTLSEYTDLTWDSFRSVPLEFKAVMGDIRCGNGLYFIIRAYLSGVEVENHSSADSVSGWEYEDVPAHWNACSGSGVNPTYIDGVNKIRFTWPTITTLLHGSTYTFRLQQAEIRSIV